MSDRARFWLALLAGTWLLSAPRALVRAQPESEEDAGVRDAGPPPALELPVLESGVELSLPAETQVPEDGIEVVLSLDPAGVVTQVTPKQSLGPDADAAIEAAARQLRFRPARRFGQPIAVQISFRFRVAAPASAQAPATAPGPSAPAGVGLPPSAAGPMQPLTPEIEPPSFGARGRVDRPPPGATSRIKLQGAELREVPGTFGEPLRVVATLPGVARSPFGLGFFVVRGASFQNTGFFIDDYPVPLLYHLGAGPAIIASRLVESLDFYPGGYPVQLGRYTAGVIALHTAPPERDRLSFEFEIDALRASGLLVVPLPDQRGTVALALRRSYFELILPLITDDVSLSYTDYQLLADVRITKKLRASLFFFGSRDSLRTEQAAFSTSGGAGVSTGLEYEFDQAILTLDYTPRDDLTLRWSSTVGPSHIGFSNEREGADSLGTDTHALRLGERLDARFRLERFETRVGIDLDVFLASVQAAAPSVAELPYIPSPGPPATAVQVRDNLTQLGIAPFIEQVWRPHPFEFALGFRAEHLAYGEVSTWLPEPRGVVRCAITPALSLKGGSGLYSQPPLPFQVLRTAGNPRLAPNRALQNSIGADIKLPLAITVESNLFYNLMWQLTRASGDLIVDADKKLHPEFYADDGRGRSYGFELMLRRRAERGLTGWLSYTLSRSERFLASGASQVFMYDQTHVLNFALSYTLGAFRFGARLTLATGRPVADLLDPSGQSTIFDADQDDLDPSVRGKTTRLPTFQQVDVRIDRDFVWGPLSGSVYLDIINVFNAQNGEAYQYEYDFSRRGKLPGLPFLPTLGVRGVLR